MSWRPDNWKPLDNPDLHSVYEAGADAMLKAVEEFIGPEDAKAYGSQCCKCLRLFGLED